MKFRNILNKNIRYLIENERYTISLLSNELNISRATLTNFYYDKAIPNLSFLIKFAERFGYSIDDLLKKDLTQSDFVNENAPEYRKLDKDYYIKTIELKDKEIELLKKETDIYKKLANECEKYRQQTEKRLKELSKQTGNLLEGKKRD